MSTELLFIINYECPRCHASLEARASGPPPWLRCPSCGRASLPPDHERAPSPMAIDGDTLVIGDFGTTPGALPIRPRSMAPLPGSPTSQTSNARVFLGTGLFVTVLLFVFSLLESNGILSLLSGIVAVFLLFLLSRKSSPNPQE